MVRVAVAGGTGGLGRTLVEELVKSNKHEVFIFSRKHVTYERPKQSALSFEALSNVHCISTPYTSIDNLVEQLRGNEIHTAISTLSPPTPEVHSAQINLIRAAAQSGTVKRFAPSEWGIDLFSDDEHLPLDWKGFKREAVQELENHPELEYSLFLPGFFLDYFGMPHCPSHMLAEVPYVDIAAGKAAIPGSGNEKIVMTYTRDVAKYVRKAVESEEKWPKTSIIVGDRFTLNEVVQAAERARGIKFEVVHDSLEDLRNGKISEIPAYVPVYEVLPKEMFLSMMAGLGVGMITGIFDLTGHSLNERYPDIRPVKMVDFVQEFWAGK